MILSNEVSTLQKWQPGMTETVRVLQFDTSDLMKLITYSGDHWGFRSMLGGIVLATTRQYESTANLRLPVKLQYAPFIVNATGQATTNYLTSAVETYGNCSMT